jgi:hypothetical protein
MTRPASSHVCCHDSMIMAVHVHPMRAAVTRQHSDQVAITKQQIAVWSKQPNAACNVANPEAAIIPVTCNTRHVLW